MKNNKLPSVKQIESERQRLLNDISKLSALHKDIKEEYDEIAVLKKKVDIFLDIKPEQKAPKKKPSILKKLAEHREHADMETEQTQYHKGHNIQTITDKINYKTNRVKKLQTEIKALETKKTHLENEEIINAVNEANIPIGRLKEVLKLRKERNGTI